jgi:hypothetical protein
LKVSVEYQKLLQNLQVLEQENKTLKGSSEKEENDSTINKKKSIKESEVFQLFNKRLMNLFLRNINKQ